MRNYFKIQICFQLHFYLKKQHSLSINRDKCHHLFKITFKILCFSKRKKKKLTLTQSVPDEFGLHFVVTFSPDLDCTIICVALKAKNLVNLSRSFLSCILKLIADIAKSPA